MPVTKIENVALEVQEAFIYILKIITGQFNHLRNDANCVITCLVYSFSY